MLLDNIWKGKDTSSGVAYSSSRTGNSTENSSGFSCTRTDSVPSFLIFFVALNYFPFLEFVDFQVNKEKSAQVQSEDPVGMLVTAPDDPFVVKAGHGRSFSFPFLRRNISSQFEDPSHDLSVLTKSLNTL